MTRAWGVLCNSWKGCQCVCRRIGLWTAQVVRLATVSGRPCSWNCLEIPWIQIQAAGRCTRANVRDMSTATSKRERQELLPKTFFQEHTRWLDNSEHKRNPRLFDFRDKEFEEVHWLNTFYKPAWADALPATPCERMDQSSFDCTEQITGGGSEKSLTPEAVKKLCRQGQVREAVEALKVLVGMNSGVDKSLLYSVLKECVVKKDLMLGGQLHALAVKTGFGTDTFLCNQFIRMYSGHGKLQEAMDVFRGVVLPDAFTWSAVISAHARQGQSARAIELYQHMRATRTKPDGHVLVAALQACAAAKDLQLGKQMHVDVFTNAMEHDRFVCSCLVDMYAKCGSLKDARKLFDGLHEKDVVIWNAMIAGYAQQEGMGQEALSLYTAMHNDGMAAPNAVTFICLLQACANVGASALETGKQFHLQLQNRRLESDVVVGGSLVNMYVKCGSIKHARIVFDVLSEKNVVTWTAMIAGYAQQEGMAREALNLYSAMRNKGMAAPNAVTYACLLQACANVGVLALDDGKQLHLHLKERKLESDVVIGGSLVNMYVKCGSLKEARIVFDGLVERNVVTWNAMIAGYAQQDGMGQEALNVYSAMHKEGIVTPDALTFLCLLDACTSVGALQQGKQLHLEICERGFEFDTFIATSLVKMYSRCGQLEVSREIFARLPVKSLVTWNALLKGYAENGEAGMAVQCFEELLEQGIQPNEVTYICLFSACSRAGLVDQGQQYFETMLQRHGVEPIAQHYSCMVDLLVRSGHLGKAEQMLQGSGLAGDSANWRALLSGCKSYGDAELGRRCFDHLVKLEPTDATAYMLLGGIYANAGRWDDVGKIESLRRAAQARNVPGKACIEVRKEVHEFTVGAERSDVAEILRKMNSRVKDGGHVPQTQLVLRAASEQEKEDALCGHAEKLALAYGLLNTPAGSTLVVTKNLRMCTDCHSSTKVLSRLEKREIVVRDGHKVHRFLNGACSCLDRP